VTEPSVQAIAAYAAFGLIVGLGYFVSLRLNVDLYIDRGRPGWLPILMHGLRIAAAVAFFAWLASCGALPLLSSFAGFLAGRMVAFRISGKRA
jgi:F1F0 ATPase subunit 2